MCVCVCVSVCVSAHEANYCIRLQIYSLLLIIVCVFVHDPHLKWANHIDLSILDHAADIDNVVKIKGQILSTH